MVTKNFASDAIIKAEVDPGLAETPPSRRRMTPMERQLDKMAKRHLRRQGPRLIREVALSVSSILARPKKYGMSREGAQEIVERKLDLTERKMRNLL